MARGDQPSCSQSPAKLGRTSTLSYSYKLTPHGAPVPLSHRRGDQGPERPAGLASAQGHQRRHRH